MALANTSVDYRSTIGQRWTNYRSTVDQWSTYTRQILPAYLAGTWSILHRQLITMYGYHASVDYWSSISPLSVNCPLIDRPRPPIAHMLQASYTWSVAQSRAGILVNNHKAQLLLGTFGLLFIEKLRSQNLSHLCNSTTGDNQNPCTFIEEQLKWTKINNQEVI